MKPKEGTILTVARGIAEKAEELAFETEDLEEIFPKILDHAQQVLEQTPELLPVLKEAGGCGFRRTGTSGDFKRCV